MFVELRTCGMSCLSWTELLLTLWGSLPFMIPLTKLEMLCALVFASIWVIMGLFESRSQYIKIYFSIQLGTIIPFDELIFFRGVGQPPTSSGLSSFWPWNMAIVGLYLGQGKQPDHQLNGLMKSWILAGYFASLRWHEWKCLKHGYHKP